MSRGQLREHVPKRIFSGRSRELTARPSHRGIPDPAIPVDPPYHGLMADFPGIAHAALTVSDLDQSVRWYERLFGAEPDKLDDGGAFRAAVWILTGGTVIALHQFKDPKLEAFDEFRPGLDHLAFGCSSRGELASWAARLDALNIGHGDICDEPYGSGLSFRDPDNIALEFFSPAT